MATELQCQPLLRHDTAETNSRVDDRATSNILCIYRGQLCSNTLATLVLTATLLTQAPTPAQLTLGGEETVVVETGVGGGLVVVTGGGGRLVVVTEGGGGYVLVIVVLVLVTGGGRSVVVTGGGDPPLISSLIATW